MTNIPSSVEGIQQRLGPWVKLQFWITASSQNSHWSLSLRKPGGTGLLIMISMGSCTFRLSLEHVRMSACISKFMTTPLNTLLVLVDLKGCPCAEECNPVFLSQKERGCVHLLTLSLGRSIELLGLQRTSHRAEVENYSWSTDWFLIWGGFWGLATAVGGPKA